MMICHYYQSEGRAGEMVWQVGKAITMHAWAPTIGFPAPMEKPWVVTAETGRCYGFLSQPSQIGELLFQQKTLSQGNKTERKTHRVLPWFFLHCWDVHITHMHYTPKNKTKSTMFSVVFSSGVWWVGAEPWACEGMAAFILWTPLKAQGLHLTWRLSFLAVYFIGSLIYPFELVRPCLLDRWSRSCLEYYKEWGTGTGSFNARMSPNGRISFQSSFLYMYVVCLCFTCA